MKDTSKYSIPKPCNKRWGNMENTHTSDLKKCQNCNKKVYDIRTKTSSEIEDLYEKNAKSICVIAHTNQLFQNSENNTYSFNLRKIGIASLLIGSSLLPLNLHAQKHKKTDSFTIAQTDLKSENVIIEGIVKVKGLVGWKKLDNYNINIHSNKILISDVLIDKKGTFKIVVNKELLSDTISISIRAYGYKSVQIKEIEVKDTMLNVYLHKRARKPFTMGKIGY